MCERFDWYEPFKKAKEEFATTWETKPTRDQKLKETEEILKNTSKNMTKHYKNMKTAVKGESIQEEESHANGQTN